MLNIFTDDALYPSLKLPEQKVYRIILSASHQTLLFSHRFISCIFNSFYWTFLHCVSFAASKTKHRSRNSWTKNSASSHKEVKLGVRWESLEPLIPSFVEEILSLGVVSSRRWKGSCWWGHKRYLELAGTVPEMDSKLWHRLGLKALPKASYYWRLHFLHWKKKWSHFDLKSRVTGGTKIRPGISSNWRIFESNWLSISSQNSILRVSWFYSPELNINLKKCNLDTLM